MPIGKLSIKEYEFRTILGIKIPIVQELEFGQKLQHSALSTQVMNQAFSNDVFLARMFCVLTEHSQASRQVTWSELYRSHLTEDEQKELTEGTRYVLNQLKSVKDSWALVEKLENEVTPEDGGKKAKKTKKQVKKNS